MRALFFAFFLLRFQFWPNLQFLCLFAPRILMVHVAPPPRPRVRPWPERCPPRRTCATRRRRPTLHRPTPPPTRPPPPTPTPRLRPPRPQKPTPQPSPRPPPPRQSPPLAPTPTLQPSPPRPPTPTTLPTMPLRRQATRPGDPRSTPAQDSDGRDGSNPWTGGLEPLPHPAYRDKIDT